MQPLADSSDLSMAIQQYRHALESIKHDIHYKKWSSLTLSQAMVLDASELLRTHLPETMTEDILNELSQLSLMQRRVTRQLNEQMNRVSEDLSYLEKGMKQVRQFSDQLTESKS